jgi:hypothetical protein
MRERQILFSVSQSVFIFLAQGRVRLHVDACPARARAAAAARAAHAGDVPEQDHRDAELGADVVHARSCMHVTSTCCRTAMQNLEPTLSTP